MISVVMPVYNAATTLPAALDSLTRQTSADWELVAVDDGSTDASGAILDAYAGRDRRLRIVSTPHAGIVAALNTALGVARGQVIARMDADDVCLPDRLERQRRHLEEHPALGLVASRVRFGGDRVAGGGYARHVEWTNQQVTHEQISLARFVESPLAHPSVMFRSDVARRWGGYASGDFPEDYELWLRWLEAGVRMEKLTEPLLVWNDSAARLSRCDPRYADSAFYRVKAGYLARWLARHNAHHPAVLLWGAGRISRRRARHVLDEGVRIRAFIDVDPRKIGRVIHGCPVLDPGALPKAGTAFIVSFVRSRGAREAIEAHLRAAGYRPGVDYILAA
ncbi:MAG: glycosyltransferase [Candidatus Rokuibacteriota bacterium]